MKVLVAIDNKPSSQAIVDALVKMHWFEGTEIIILYAAPPGTGYGANEPSPALQELENLAVDLHAILRFCEVSFLVREGDPKTTITQVAREIHADFIVIGSNCKNTLERLLLGSVCQTVINEAHCPVFVAKTPCCLAREVSPAYKTILIPVDASIFSDAALAWLTNFNWSAHTQFVIAAVIDYDTDRDQVSASLTSRAHALGRRLGNDNIILVTTFGKPSQSIIELAKAYYADMIVMGSHNRTGIQKLLVGEIADQVSQHAPCAVAIVQGVVPNEAGGTRAEAFGKIKPLATSARGYLDYGSPGDISGHIMPGGM